jgi:Family of unknown function (DUF6510)
MAENISDLILDGNAAAGCLHEIFASDITIAQIQCDACSSTRPVGSLRLLVKSLVTAIACPMANPSVCQVDHFTSDSGILGESDTRRIGISPYKRRKSGHFLTAASCQKRTHAVQQKDALFDHLVGPGEQRRWHVKARRPFTMRCPGGRAPRRKKWHRGAGWRSSTTDPHGRQ